jgi:hypothetical protein
VYGGRSTGHRLQAVRKEARTVTLWHFTCEHGHAAIGERGLLVPNHEVPVLGIGHVIWFTDNPEPDRIDVGLTSTILACDRMQYRYRALSASKCIPYRALRYAIEPSWRSSLEQFGKPETWWISRVPIRAVLDQIDATNPTESETVLQEKP